MIAYKAGTDGNCSRIPISHYRFESTLLLCYNLRSVVPTSESLNGVIHLVRTHKGEGARAKACAMCTRGGG